MKELTCDGFSEIRKKNIILTIPAPCGVDMFTRPMNRSFESVWIMTYVKIVAQLVTEFVARRTQESHHAVPYTVEPEGNLFCHFMALV